MNVHAASRHVTLMKTVLYVGILVCMSYQYEVRRTLLGFVQFRYLLVSVPYLLMPLLHLGTSTQDAEISSFWYEEVC